MDDNKKTTEEPQVESLPAMSDFWEDSLWMSWRYCIGRHTIAAHARARDIAEFITKHDLYNNHERRKFWASDIINEISMCIRWRVKDYFDGGFDDVDRILNEVNEGKHKEEFYSLNMELGDLFVWYGLAKWLDTTQHKKAKFRHGDQEEEHTYFYTWSYNWESKGEAPYFKRVMVEVSNFPIHGADWMLCEEYMVEGTEEPA